MADLYIQDRLVDVGLVANDGTGDDLREAFVKINENVQYIGDRIGSAVSGANVGAAGESIFKSTTGSQLSFRKVAAAGNLSIITVDDVITLQFNPTSAVNLNGNSITNAGEVTATGFSGPLTGAVIGNVTGDVTGNVTGNSSTVTNGVYTTGTYADPAWITELAGSKVTGTVTATIIGNVTGNITGLIKTTDNDTFVDVSFNDRRINTFDYGFIDPVFTDALSYYTYVIGTDMGTFNNPSEFSIDAGTINGD